MTARLAYNPVRRRSQILCVYIHSNTQAKERVVKLHVGVKSDPIEYRFSYKWLFRLMAEEGVAQLQLGTFFELYHLPDTYFIRLREEAEQHGIRITSIFTAHRELGGFFRFEPGWEKVARRNYERLIEVGALLGAVSVGSNPGALMRDEIARKQEGIARYLRHMQELQCYAYEKGLQRLTIEPMSCLAEPPTLPDEIVYMARTLEAHHREHPQSVPTGFCVDVSHGYADGNGTVRHSPVALLETALPYLAEIHLKNTDSLFNSTFGFTKEERRRGIVDVDEVAHVLVRNADRLPVEEVTGYLEIGGPKLGRDYSDKQVEGMLRESLQFLVEHFTTSHRPGFTQSETR